MIKFNELVDDFLVSNFTPNVNLGIYAIRLFETKQQFVEFALEHTEKYEELETDFTSVSKIISEKQAIEYAERFTYSIAQWFEFIANYKGLNARLYMRKIDCFSQFQLTEITSYLTIRAIRGNNEVKYRLFMKNLAYYYIMLLAKHFQNFIKFYDITAETYY